MSISLTGVIQIKVQVKNVYLSASVPLNSKSISFANYPPVIASLEILSVDWLIAGIKEIKIH